MFGLKVMELASYYEMCEEIRTLRLEKKQLKEELESKGEPKCGDYCSKCQHSLRVAAGGFSLTPNFEYYCSLNMPCDEFEQEQKEEKSGAED